MKLTAITATYQRPAAFALCEKLMAAQTRQPDQWLVLDGPEPMQAKVLAAIEVGKVEGEAVAFFEDDDHYAPGWLAWVEAKVSKGYDLVGEGNAVYYNVRNRWWSECRNPRHAALCQTGCHRSFLEIAANVIKSYDSPWFDTRIWEVEVAKFLSLPKSPKERQVVGIKGILNSTAAFGYSGEHRDVLPEGSFGDPSLLKLWQWIGEDAANYSRFSQLKTPKL